MTAAPAAARKVPRRPLVFAGRAEVEVVLTHIVQYWEVSIGTSANSLSPIITQRHLRPEHAAVRHVRQLEKCAQPRYQLRLDRDADTFAAPELHSNSFAERNQLCRNYAAQEIRVRFCVD